MAWNVLHVLFINAMVSAMYREEARQVLNPNLLTEAECKDFYTVYCGGGPL